MRDIRDPETVYNSILATRRHFGCSLLEAADRVELMRDDLITISPTSYLATPEVPPTTYIPLATAMAQSLREISNANVS